MAIELEESTALVLIDLQTGVVGIPSAHPIESVVANSAALAEAYRAKGLSVALVNVSGTAPGRTERGKAQGHRGGSRTLPPEATVLVPELNAQSSDILVTKTTLGAFLSTDLDAQLRARGVTQIVLGGVATTSGVESTARTAYELGYHVAFVLDAMTDSNGDAHDASVAHQFPKLGELGTTAEVLEQLSTR